jgi:hypothetical protein
MNGNEGFIIISGDDVAKPVLGYSGDGAYDESNPNLAYWMDMLSQEIVYAVENGLSQDEQTKAAWQAFENENPVQSSGDYVEPLITTQWDQGAPYNNLCPVISGKRALAGCVATAMAQIMKYHEYPATRTVEIPGYTTRTKAIKINPITGSTSYNWNNMTDTYYSSGTSAENEAVATLMYHCGAGVKMDYDIEESYGYFYDVLLALKNYFDYDSGISFLEKLYYSNSRWRDMLKTELNAGRPVYYGGQGSEGGHAFVCDGYDIHDRFHFNWGWGGYSDGYFELSALNPNSAGYNQEQIIITGIKPNGAIQLELSSFYANKILLDSLTESFSITMAALKNTGSVKITKVNLGVLLYSMQDDSCISNQMSPQQMSMRPLSFTEYTSDCSLPSGLPAGTYKLYPAYSLSSETPSIIPGKNGIEYITVVVNDDGSVNLSGMPELSVSFWVNGNPLSAAEKELYYQAGCGDTPVRLDVEVSVAASVTVSVNSVDVNSRSIPLSGDSTVININIVSDDNRISDYRLTVLNPLDANAVLFRRWDDVVAVNRNPDNNGGRKDIESVRWYIDGSAEALNSWFIRLTEGEEYRAEISIANKWHQVCGDPKKHSTKIVACPNPVSTGENLTLLLPDSFAGGYMNVISLAGSTVKHKSPLPDSFNIISLAGWAPGIYLLNIIAPDGEMEVTKIIVSD